MEIKLTSGRTLREVLIQDFGLMKSNVESMTDDEVDEELRILIGETEEY